MVQRHFSIKLLRLLKSISNERKFSCIDTSHLVKYTSSILESNHPKAYNELRELANEKFTIYIL